MVLVFATGNKHKLEEVRAMMPPHFQLLGLKDIGCQEELPETGNTLEHNAIQKARYVYDKYGYECFADDSGLEVEILDGAPGVYSARYAGPEANFTNNIRKLLNEMDQVQKKSGDVPFNRKARFRTVIALILRSDDPKPLLFEGSVQGEITEHTYGKAGFGYDPIFIPEGFHITYAEMIPELKNRISHRAIAINRLKETLKNIAP